MEIGLIEQDRKQIADFLNGLLASSYSLYLKTQFFHWNVQGPHFYALHVMFEKQYEEFPDILDEMAERIRALGFFAKGSFEAFVKDSVVKGEDRILSAEEMLQELLQDHETVICFLRKHLPIAEKVEDGATADFINKRLASHEKVAWMLRSHLTS